MTSTTADAATGVPQDSNPTPAPKRITAAAPNASTPPEMPHGGLATDQPTWCRKELAHITLHQPETVAAGTDSPVPVCRGRIEVEAESVAYLIASAHDLDASAFSFAYVAGWAQQAGGDVEQVLAETATRVLGAAHRILDRLDRDNPAPLPLPEDAVPFELPGPARAPVVPGPPVDPGRHPIVPLGATAASRGQAGVGR